MHLVYVDDSRDEKRGCVFSALSIPANQWNDAFGSVRTFRRELKKSDGIYVHKEFHAWKFISGRGKISDGIVTKGRRCQIFESALRLVADLPGAKLFNALFPADKDEQAFEWLINRIDRTMKAWDSRAILICDDGKEVAYTRLMRKMRIFNPIPSNQGLWADTGNRSKNIPIEYIIEDPFFKASNESYFIQLVDFVAYALLRREFPVDSKSKYGIDRMFGLLSGILVREACKKNPEGIITP